MDIREYPITETALYKLCLAAYKEHQEHMLHEYNDGLAKLHADTEDYLKMSVDPVDGEIVVTFVLKKKDLVDATS